ncbi:MAG: TolC family protein [Desulfobulbaceae bacterium]|nr:TolC family protein [Desulfobulbaceae bacterium]
MLIQLYHILIFLTVFCVALSCSAGQKETNTVHINSLVFSDLGEFEDTDVMYGLADPVSTSFAMFHIPAEDQDVPVARREQRAIHINRLVVSYFGQLEDDEVILGLDDLITIGLNNNRQLEVVRQKVLQSQGQLTQARSGYLPHLELQGRYNYAKRSDSDSSGTSVNTGNGETDEGDVLLGTVNFSQLIYDFGKTTGAIDAGKLNLKAIDAQLQRQLQDVIFQVKVAYYNVLEKRRLIDVAAESVRSFRQHLDRAKLYLKAGVRTKIDVINAEVELSNANMSLLRAEYDFKKARVALEQVLGKRPKKGRYVLKSDEVRLHNVLETMPPVPDTLESLIDVSMVQRPDIIQLYRLIDAAEANLVRVKGSYWPSITAEAKYNDYHSDMSVYEDNWEVGVAATWEIFSGLHTKGSVAEANGLLLENKAQLQDQQLVVVREVTESYLEADENRESVQIALQTLELSKENLHLAEKRYKSGANDVIEFNDAQINLTRSRSEVVVTYYGYLTALAGIEYSIGKFL